MEGTDDGDVFADIAYITDTLSFLPDDESERHMAYFLEGFLPAFQQQPPMMFASCSTLKLIMAKAERNVCRSKAEGGNRRRLLSRAHLLLRMNHFSNLDVFSQSGIQSRCC
ncbi:MAG: hypothetical protein ACLTDX_02250 [[Clostridium] innocuum]